MQLRILSLLLTAAQSFLTKLATKDSIEPKSAEVIL